MKRHLKEDLNNIPIIDSFEFVNNSSNMFPGITNMGELAQKLNKVGKDKFAVRFYRLKNVSEADIKDTFGGVTTQIDYGWDAWIDRDQNYKEYVIFKKCPKITFKDVTSKNESLHGMNEIEQFVNMGEALGLKTMGDLKDFLDREGQGKDILTALYDYLQNDIGDLDFQVKNESLKESSNSDWILIKSKKIYDSDGSLTDYTWYENSEGLQGMIFWR